MRLRHILTGFVLLALASCATSGVQTQATTVAEAVQTAALVEKSLDLYVQSGSPNKSVLLELKVLVPAVHNALVQAEAANAAGNSAAVAAALSTFNESVSAVNSYEASKGVSQ